MAASSADLLGRMAGGDREAFAVFYDRFAPLAFALILRIIGERADAGDVLQELFWDVWQGAGRYEPRAGSPEAWLITQARSRAVDRVRAMRRHGVPLRSPLEETAPPAAGRDAADRGGGRATVRSALERLPAPQREVIELAYYAGLTQAEIAERLKQPLDAVKTRIRLGLERLRDVAGTSP
jgi:RNA polymerase sigma-70 factor (ECF subfamily)